MTGSGQWLLFEVSASATYAAGRLKSVSLLLLLLLLLVP
jgi:hypothetical protein